MQGWIISIFSLKFRGTLGSIYSGMITGLLLVTSMAAFADQAEKTALPVAPDWQLTTQQGKPVALSDYRGKPLILHFWATWCPYCKRVQPGLDALYQQYQSQGLQAVAISFREDDDATPGEVLANRGITFPTAVNGEQVAANYGVRGTPTTFLIDTAGRVVYATNTSDPNDEALRNAVKTLVNP
ncbi:peroxiredoxin family protein [Corallincola platygyrae]|uniref:Peroxiredoxin family protein n=1 Tax=Corallincola platygyrae TaxID=1193278 RepID=A0ABW4XMI4_9GAMM